MSNNELDNLQQSVHGVFAALYLVDVETLTLQQKQQHQQALSAAYLAYVKAENLEYTELAAPLEQQLTELAQRVGNLGKQMAGRTVPQEQLQLAVDNLDGLNRLTQLLGLLETGS
ncbi:MAG TPA: hypothetical protein VFV28_01635 [Limnobacter sp.]|nr:hypothetical protein [Limnobacter sp.]